MRGLTTFLVKALTIVGAGGGPLILQVYSSSKITELPRKFQWTLNLNLNSQDSSGRSVEAKKAKESYWLEGLNKNKWQGVEQSKWGELSGKTARSAYKLAFRSSWIQEEDEKLGDKSAKGALALIKASWGGFDGAKNKDVRTEEIQVGKDKRVWLIIAKSESSIYLIPVVRASSEGDTSSYGRSSGKIENDIWEHGIEDIGTWAKKFDTSDSWEPDCNENLKKKYKSGIVISRGGSILNKNADQVTEWRREGRKIVYYEGNQKKEKEWNKEESVSDEVRLWRNAGWIRGNTLHRRVGKCQKNEKYFPLDISVLGNANKLENKTSSSRSLVQEIEINDKITQVMGVRLDQVIISDTGIGEGKKNEIKWGSITKPTLIRELLK
ncbi:hypothetical protein WEN_03120 [Mycoplasma wenyonii str. Massachusetts]|uniref:Uncharacterized protein n=1 Tax=Mycoplasma wenyonii (strain Massachusetts) TaxID=1197325 RepID=I6ZJM5_MYCWM|nr:hypothetical protein [Mycoplasma wenyonii]AFN65405.1 hypothetical protein WEN_03120 [Mycoplasma wenyonii str. Massachusetts]